MKINSEIINSEIINGVLGTLLSPEEPIIQGTQVHQLREIVHRLVIGLNDIGGIYDQMEFLKEDQSRLDAKHVEETGEIEDEMVRLQEQCPHFSHANTGLFGDDDNLITVVICNICGKILEQEITP